MVEKVEKVEKVKSGEISGQKWRNLCHGYEGWARRSEMTRHRLRHRLLRPQRGHRRLQQRLLHRLREARATALLPWMSFRLQTNQTINKGQNNHRREYGQATTTFKWVGTPSHYKIQMS